MNNKILLIGLVLVSLASTTMAAGLDNTVDSTAAHYGAEAYGYTNTITATGRSAFVTGYNNTVSANNALVYGIENKAEGINSLVGGEYAKATGRNSVAIGSHAEALQDNTFAIGSQARANGADVLAFGNGATVSGESSVAIGRSNNVTAKNTTVVGANNGFIETDKTTHTIIKDNTIKSDQSAIFGYNNTVKGNAPEQLIFGSNSITENQGTVVVGTHGQAIAQDAVAFGNNTLADVQNSVALGTNSVTGKVTSTTSAIINGHNYTFAGGEANSTVSVGVDPKDEKSGLGGITKYKRTIINVAAGRISDTSTDAINGSQLHSVIQEVNHNGQNIKINTTLANQALTEAKKHTIVIAGDNTTVTPGTNANGGAEYKVSVSKDFSDQVDNNTSRINDLDNKITDVGRNALERANHYTDLQINKGVAKASALAGLKFLDYNPKDKWSFAASVGHYRNANAVAVGAAYQPNENTMVHGGITLDGKVAYNLGVSFKTGGQKYINKYELADQVKQLQSDNALLRQELNELRSMIENK